MWYRAASNIQIRGNGKRVNLADFAYAQFLSDTGQMSWARRLWFATDYQTVVSSSSRVYSFTAPSDKYIAIYSREITVTKNLWEVETLSGATYTPGTTITPQNSFVGDQTQTSALVLTSGVTGVSGETIERTEPIPGATSPGQTGGGLTGVGVSPIVYPPNTDLLLRLNNQGTTDASVMIQFAYAELDADELPAIEGNISV